MQLPAVLLLVAYILNSICAPQLMPNVRRIETTVKIVIKKVESSWQAIKELWLSPFLLLLVLSLLALGMSCTQTEKVEEFTDEEIAAKFQSLWPKEEDFKFFVPPSWSSNLATHANIALGTTTQDLEDAKKIIDGSPASTWACMEKPGEASVVIDLGQEMIFNKLVLFNRCTDQRGTAGGNNALKRFSLFVSNASFDEDSHTLGTFTIDGPKAVCFRKKGGGQVCAFIDKTEPSIIDLPTTETRFLKFVLEEAFWGEHALEEWKSSVALSEIMIFRAPGNDA
jgi:hypothetical protein